MGVKKYLHTENTPGTPCAAWSIYENTDSHFPSANQVTIIFISDAEWEGTEEH